MINKEQMLLSKLYECQEIMAQTLKDGKDDHHYFLMEVLIARLEKYLQNQQDILG
jgi:hypothetical protein